MWCIIWILISAVIFGWSGKSEKWEWLGFPSIVSFMLGMCCGAIKLFAYILNI